MTIRIAHLYGNLMNTYGDNGNLLMLQYMARQASDQVTTEIISIDDGFDPDRYNLVFFGGGQDYEQSVVSEDIQKKKDGLIHYIENGGTTLAICGGYQLLGHYYLNPAGQRLEGIGALDCYSEGHDDRLIGDIKVHAPAFDMDLVGYENHAGRTYLGEGLQPLGQVIEGHGNNGEDGTEGALYKHTVCSYFHGPLLVRNPDLAKRIVQTALDKAVPEK